MKAAIVILNYNGVNFLRQFLALAVQHSSNYPVYVIDNQSTDNSVEYILKEYPNVKLIVNKENGGFAKGYNDGLKHINAEYYALVNSDLLLPQNWILPLIELLEQEKNIASVQPKIKSFNNKDYFEHAGAAGGFIDKIGYAFCRGRIFNMVEKDLAQYNESGEIFWSTGAAMVVRAEYFWQVGGFDEDFFAHMEEIDLCWRFKNKGYSIWYSSASEVFHVGGGTLSYDSPRKVFLNFRNNLCLLLKNLPTHLLIPLLFFRLVLDGFAGFQFLINSGPKHLLAIIRAHFHFYYLIPKMWKKRMLNHPTKYPLYGMYNGIIPFDYFLKKKYKFNQLKMKNFQQ
jgi:GT2 family glycosyltransferase